MFGRIKDGATSPSANGVTEKRSTSAGFLESRRTSAIARRLISQATNGRLGSKNFCILFASVFWIIRNSTLTTDLLNHSTIQKWSQRPTDTIVTPFPTQ